MLIKEVFKEFLNEQKNNLSKKTFDEYKSVIELFADSLHGYAWNNIDDCDEAYNKAESKKLEFVDLYDHTHVLSNEEITDYCENQSWEDSLEEMGFI